MREYLFRGKSLDTGKWVYGYFANLKWYYDDSDKTIIIPEDGELYPHCEISEYEPVDPETVGQWTGLVDKNGVKIFEGDVVKYKHCFRFLYNTTLSEHVADGGEYVEREAIITYMNCEFTPKPMREDCEDYWYSYGCFDFEVIGNKWDNSELAEEWLNEKGINI